MTVRTHAFSGLVVALTLTSPPVADRDCRVGSERHETAVSQVIDALRAYEKCVLSSQKRDDCAGQLGVNSDGCSSGIARSPCSRSTLGGDFGSPYPSRRSPTTL